MVIEEVESGGWRGGGKASSRADKVSVGDAFGSYHLHQERQTLLILQE